MFEFFAYGLFTSFLLLCFLLLGSLLICWFAPREGFLRRKVVENIPSIWLISSLCVGLALWPLYWTINSTHYSDGYSEQRFRKVRENMSEQQVLKLLGSPLDKWKPYQNNDSYINRQHYIGFVYSEPESGDGDYEMRQIIFDNGKVAEVRNYRYYD
jgi:outer membrane protein assembly factor BamE (lipoprotein component of BamABCDE complex)